MGLTLAEQLAENSKSKLMRVVIHTPQEEETVVQEEENTDPTTE